MHDKVIEALDQLRSKDTSFASLESIYGSESVRALNSLGLTSTEGKVAQFVGESSEPSRILVRNAAAAAPTVQFVREFIEAHPDALGVTIGRAVSEQFNFNWSRGSMKKWGGAIRRWSLWLMDRQQIGRGRRPSERRFLGAKIETTKSPSVARSTTKTGRSRLSLEQSREIAYRWHDGETAQSLADQFGISRSRVFSIKRRHGRRRS